MNIQRILEKKLIEAIEKGRDAVILYGPRQAGKTTLIERVLESLKLKALVLSGDDVRVQEELSQHHLDFLKKKLGKSQLLVIDEAQRINNIGLTLKLLHDQLKVKLFVSGSSSFELANRLNEPMTGRTRTFTLYPLAYSEIKPLLFEKPKEQLEEILRFGMYPRVWTLETEKEKEEYLRDLLNNYLYKDILIFEKIRKPKKVLDLLTLLALQIGSEVKISELATQLGISQQTVEIYLDALEKMFVIVNLRGFSRNLRSEIAKTSKYYFVDIGLRNALIGNFSQLKLRDDTSRLFENWFIIERLKLQFNKQLYANQYFWRTYEQNEIDLIEERSGKLFAYECKWQVKKKINAPALWKKTYLNSIFKTVNSENYPKFL